MSHCYCIGLWIMSGALRDLLRLTPAFCPAEPRRSVWKAGKQLLTQGAGGSWRSSSYIYIYGIVEPEVEPTPDCKPPRRDGRRMKGRPRDNMECTCRQTANAEELFWNATQGQPLLVGLALAETGSTVQR